MELGLEVEGLEGGGLEGVGVRVGVGGGLERGAAFNRRYRRHAQTSIHAYIHIP